MSLTLRRVALPRRLPRMPDVLELTHPCRLERITLRLRHIFREFDELHFGYVARTVREDEACLDAHNQLGANSAHHQLRGLSGARDEFHLAAIVQNLKTMRELRERGAGGVGSVSVGADARIGRGPAPIRPPFLLAQEFGPASPLSSRPFSTVSTQGSHSRPYALPE
jgi:hypothetical protein